MDKHLKKKKLQFGEKRTDKHFEKQQNAVWRKHERAIDASSESRQVDSFRHCNLVQPSSKLAAEASIRNPAATSLFASTIL